MIWSLYVLTTAGYLCLLTLSAHESKTICIQIEPNRWIRNYMHAETHLLDWSKSSFGFFCNMEKNPNMIRLGEGNGNPLQCSCLEKPRDCGTWWAAVYEVAQSRTRLKRISSGCGGGSSSSSRSSASISKGLMPDHRGASWVWDWSFKLDSTEVLTTEITSKVLETAH